MAVERILHHFPLDPASRQVRLALAEKRLGFHEHSERYWEQPASLQALNPSGMTPVLVEIRDAERLVICESRAILEHLEERYDEVPLLAPEPAERAEARRLLQWFDRKFDYEVNGLLLHEKMEKRLLGMGAPDLGAMRRGREALKTHFRYIDSLLQDRNWLAGSRLSLADFAAAAHLGHRLFRRCAMGRVPRGQDLVHEDQIAALLPPLARRQMAGHGAGCPL
jgi:glutathione S-transferase